MTETVSTTYDVDIICLECYKSKLALERAVELIDRPYMTISKNIESAIKIIKTRLDEINKCR